MKNISFQWSVASLLFLVLAPLAAFAQIDNHLNIDVPFPFYAGQKRLPAGKYMVTPVSDSPNALLIQGVNNHDAAFLEVEPFDGRDVRSTSSLDFNKAGKKEFLTQVWVSGQEQGYEVIGSGLKPAAGALAAHSVRRPTTALRRAG